MLKLWRANEHLEAVDAQINAWMELKPYRVWKEREAETDMTVIYAEPVGEIPLMLPAMIGDVLQNLRACLDHAAHLLSERNYGGALPEGLAGICHFPVSESAKKFAATRRSCVPHISADARAIIERVQPYNSLRGINASELTLLKTLSDFDKHRSLPVVMRVATMADPLTLALGELDKTHYAFVGALERKTALWRYRIVPEPEVNVDDGFTFELGFGDGAPPPVVGHRVQTVLSHIWAFVTTEIIRPLKPYLM